MEYSKCLGSFGEEFAVRVLMEMGFVIHDTNYKARHGEIDIIAKKGSTLSRLRREALTAAERRRML